MQQISSAEFVYWVALYELEPWGYDADMWRAGLVAAATANTAGKKRNGQPFRPSDFIPQKTKAPAAGQSLDDQRRVLQAMVGSFNG